MLRLLLMAAALALAPGAAAAAPATPEAIVRDVYARLIAGKDRAPPYRPPQGLYSRRLAALFAQARREAAVAAARNAHDDEYDEAPCGPGIDFWVDGGAYDLKALQVTRLADPAPDTEVIRAQFETFTGPHDLRLTFRNIAGRWRLDEAERVNGPEPWTLTGLLQCNGTAADVP